MESKEIEKDAKEMQEEKKEETKEPEKQQEYNIKEDECIACMSCVNACPIGCIEMVDGHAHINSELCVTCETCAGVCPLELIGFHDVAEKEEKVSD